MPTRVKICGITRLEDARRAVELGAAALGFNFYRPSPRYVPPDQARNIIDQLPPFVMPVGVFAEEKDSRRVAEVARRAGVAAVQLHGGRISPATGALQNLRVIRAIQVREGFTVADLDSEGASAYLLDAYDSSIHGGTGKIFDWSLARGAAAHATIILAGGLTPENVGRAIREAEPYAVDVATGVESRPGVKDARRMELFFEAVAKADEAR